MDLSDRIKRAEFLGAESPHLALVPRRSSSGMFDLGGDLGQVEVTFEDRLTMSSTALDEQEDSFKGGRPSSSIEAKMALRLGKLARQALKIRVTQGEQEWIFTLREAPLMMSAIKLPEIMTKGGQTQFFERMFLLEHLDRLYKALYQRFLEERLSEHWRGETLPEINRWIALGEVAEYSEGAEETEVP